MWATQMLWFISILLFFLKKKNLFTKTQIRDGYIFIPQREYHKDHT